MAYRNFGIAAVLLTALTACGGGGGGEPVVTAPPVTPTPTPADRGQWAARNTLLATYTNPTVYTPLSTIPTGGSATYDGYLSGRLANRTDTITDTLIGAMTLNVGFSGTSVQVSGSVRNVVDSGNAALSGQLTLSSGSLNRSGNPASDATLLMSARGTLRDAQGRDLAISTRLEGDFLGAGHAAVGGEVLGSVRVNGVDQDFDGGFIGAR